MSKIQVFVRAHFGTVEQPTQQVVDTIKGCSLAEAAFVVTGCPFFEWCGNGQFSLPGSPTQMGLVMYSNVSAAPLFRPLPLLKKTSRQLQATIQTEVRRSKFGYLEHVANCTIVKSKPMLIIF